MEITFKSTKINYSTTPISETPSSNPLINKICIQHLESLGLTLENVYRQIQPVALKHGLTAVFGDSEFKETLKNLVRNHVQKISQVLLPDLQKEIGRLPTESLKNISSQIHTFDKNSYPNFFARSKIVIQEHDTAFQSALESLFFKAFERSADSFDEVTKHLPKKESLLQAKLPLNYEAAFLKSMENWKDFSTHDMNNFAVQALQLFYKKKITAAQFSTCMFYWSLRKSCPVEQIEIVPLFIKGKPNPQAKSAILQTFKIYEHPVEEKYLDQLFEKMKEAPPSEQFFFAVPEKKMPILKGSITHAIQNRIKIPLFTSYQDTNEKKMMTASFSMMQNFINVYCGNKAISIIPKIGESTLEEIKTNGKNGTRDMGIPFHGVASPASADGLKVNFERDFWMHDFYHSLIASSIPHLHRKAFIEIANKIDAISREKYAENPQMLKILAILSEKIIDMEASIYLRNNHSNSSETYFHRHLDTLIEGVANRIFAAALKTNTKAIEKKIQEELGKTDMLNVLVEASLQVFKEMIDQDLTSLKKIAETHRSNIELTIDSDISMVAAELQGSSYASSIGVFTHVSEASRQRQQALVPFAKELSMKHPNEWQKMLKESLIEKARSESYLLRAEKFLC